MDFPPNINAPNLDRGLPVYPPLIQVCRTTAATVARPSSGSSSSSASPGSSNVYASFTEQFDPVTLLFRDRESCYVLDANDIGLTAGYYVCRLIGSYLGLPIYAAGEPCNCDDDLPVWSTIQAGILTTGLQTGTGQKILQNGYWKFTSTGSGQTTQTTYIDYQNVERTWGNIATDWGLFGQSGGNGPASWNVSNFQDDGSEPSALVDLAHPGSPVLVGFDWTPNDTALFVLSGTDENDDPVTPSFAIIGPDSGGNPFLQIGINGTIVGQPIVVGGVVMGDTGVDPVTPAAVTLNSNIAKLAINAPKITVTGTGISTTYTNDSITFSTLSATATVDNTPPTTTSMTATFTSAPSSTGYLLGKITVSGTDSLAGIPVAIIVPAPTVTNTTTAIGPGSQIITVTGTGFDPNPSGNIVTITTLGTPVATCQTVSPDGTSMTVLIAAPTGTGTLSLKVNSYGGDSNTTGVAVVGTPTPGPFGPSVGANTTAIPANTTSGFIIYGNFFDTTFGNNTVTLTPSGTATVTASTGTSLTVTLSGIDPGVLYAVVTTNGTTSGAPVQVATVIGPPTITINTTKLASNAPRWSLTGTGFGDVYSTNTIALSSGTATILNTSTTTRLDFTISGQTASSLTAIVTTNGQASSSGLIATVVDVTITPRTDVIPSNQPSVDVVGANLEQTAAGSSISIYDASMALINTAAPTWVAIDGSDVVWTNPGLTLPVGALYARDASWLGDSGALTQVATVVGSLITRVQYFKAPTESNTQNLTWPTPTTAGNLLVAVCGCNTNSIGSFAVPSPWVTATYHINGFAALVVAYCENAAPQTTTGVFGGGGDGTSLIITEYSGIALSSALDQIADNGGTSASQSTGTTPATTTAYQLIIGGHYDFIASSATFSSPTNSFAIVEQGVYSFGLNAIDMVAKVVSVTGVQECTVTASGSHIYCGVLATFKGA